MKSAEVIVNAFGVYIVILRQMGRLFKRGIGSATHSIALRPKADYFKSDLASLALEVYN